MTIIVCPGFHDSFLTHSFVSRLSKLISENSIAPELVNILTFTEESILSLSAFHIVSFLKENLGTKLTTPLVFISFSAGVVGAIGASHLWQCEGGNVKAFIAVDGWGVPLFGNFPIHRMSHDYFTHWSSVLLGSGNNNFYAQPPVPHLELWRSPDRVRGLWVDPDINSDIYIANKSLDISATQFLYELLKHYDQI